jgi:cytochrome P450
LVAGFASGHGADLVADYASPLPAQVIGRLSGVPEADLPLVRSYSDDFIYAGIDPESDAGKAAKARCDAFDDHLRGLIAERRAGGDVRDGGGDLLSALLQCTDEDRNPISDERVLTHLSKDILVGGIETTTHFVANLFHQLLTTPGLYERVAADRTLVPHAVEESLRHLAPVQVVFRRTKENADIAGTAVPAGSVIVLGLTSACRDESLFPDPDQFDLSRGDTAKRHLAFNGGIHLCVGAPLARLEGVCALEAALDRIPNMKLAPGESYDRVDFFMMRGPKHLHVVF